MYKVLVTSRSFGETSDVPANILKSAGIDIARMTEKYESNRFAELLSDCDALIIGAHRLEENALKTAGKLKIICKHGTGLDNIDINMTKKYGIKVTNAPGVNAGAVADLTFGLILCVARRISFAFQEVKNGRWSKVTGVDVCGKKLGLIGFGAIARNVARRAYGFGMEVCAYDPFISTLPEDLKCVKLEKLESILSTSDFLSIHVPLNSDTEGMISGKQINCMKDGSFLINTSRGGIVDERSLYDALISGKLAGAGLDVLASESAESPLVKLENVVVTPHIGMYSVEAISAISTICAKSVVAALTGEKLN